MFEQTIVDGVKRGSQWSFAASLTVQSVLVAAALALPMLQVAKMENKAPDILYLPHLLGAHEPIQQATPRVATSTFSVPQPGRIYRPFQPPTSIPNHVATGPDLPGAPEYAIGAPPGVSDGSVINAITDLGQRQLMNITAPEPPQCMKQPIAQQGPVHVSEGVQAANLIFGPKPAYPPIARAARITGAVQLAARISTDGHIEDLRVLSGHPMLVRAAIDAVKQWVYKPTTLNGHPVEVVTDIVVNFVLNQ